MPPARQDRRSVGRARAAGATSPPARVPRARRRASRGKATRRRRRRGTCGLRPQLARASLISDENMRAASSCGAPRGAVASPPPLPTRGDAGKARVRRHGAPSRRSSAPLRATTAARGWEALQGVDGTPFPRAPGDAGDDAARALRWRRCAVEPAAQRDAARRSRDLTAHGSNTSASAQRDALESPLARARDRRPCAEAAMQVLVRRDERPRRSTLRDGRVASRRPRRRSSARWSAGGEVVGTRSALVHAGGARRAPEHRRRATAP